jgi:hypothetical protein
MATFSSPTYSNNIPANTGHGVSAISCHLHATVAVTTAMTTNDVLNFGYLPANAVVVGATLKAQSQLDSNGSPTLTFDLGTVATPALWKGAISTVGRASGVTGDTTLATAGTLTKTTAKTLVIGTCHAAAASAVAGNVEVDIEYYVEDAGGSQA